MEELNYCLELRRKISRTEEKLEDIACCIRYPKAQTFSDQPRIQSSDVSPIERYIMQQEKLQHQKILLETELSMNWSRLEKQMKDCEIDKAEIRLMYLRYNNGFSWNKCIAIMRKAEGQKWNANRVFRVNRGVQKKLETAYIHQK